MNQRTSLYAALLSLILTGLYQPGCSPTIAPAAIGFEQPAPPTESVVKTTREDWARIRPVYWTTQDGSRFVAPWHFWANPLGQWLPDYAQHVYAPLRGQKGPQPLSYRPLYDSQLQTVCLFYQASDGVDRCLPGWVQLQPDDQRDGYYSEPTCSNKDRWVYVLPTAQTRGPLAQRFLVVSKMSGSDLGNVPSVYAAVPFTGRVWWRHLVSDGVRICEEVQGRDALSFFEKGAEQPSANFVPRGNLAIDVGPN